MLPLNDYLYLKDYKLNKLPVVVDKAEEYRLLVAAGIVRRPWLTCHVCRSLWRLGRMLMMTGQRLEQRYAPLAFQPA